MPEAPTTSDAASAHADPALLGRVVAGKYRIDSLLGGGAMGAVYRAHQAALEKNVALKVMHRSLAIDPSFVGRFHREAKAASRLDHPNSMRVLDFGEEPDGLLYIAMEYVEGRDLFRVMQEDWPISNTDIADILMQALSAIAVAHEMGVIHRDLKPENLMILRAKDDEDRESYHVKVCDFGIAKLTEKDDELGTGPAHRLTTQGVVVGTPEYMSPEQAKGEKLDPRADIYSIGVILYQLLTGRTPFVGASAVEVVIKHVTEQPAPPSVHYALVHRELEAVCMRALAKDRDARFQTARAMRTAIRVALDPRSLPRADSAPAPRGASLATPTFSLTSATSKGVTLAAPSVPASEIPRSRSRTWSRVGWALFVLVLIASGIVLTVPRVKAQALRIVAGAALRSMHRTTCRTTIGALSPNALPFHLEGVANTWASCAERTSTARALDIVVHMTFGNDRSFQSASCSSCSPPFALCVAAETNATSPEPNGASPLPFEFDVPASITCE
jgi:serine/threonine-protein kinase